MRRIRIAQIGINRHSHGLEIFKSICKLSDLFEVVGYTLVENEREECANKLHVFDGYCELSLDEIMNDPTIEAVTVETDEIHLNKYAQMAAEHGKHIHMEKPGSQDHESFERLINTVKTGGKVFHTGYMYRYNPIISDLIKRVRAGELGEIYSVEAQMNCRHKDYNREWLNTFKGGMMFFLGCHLVDLVLQLQGTPSNIIPLNKSTGTEGVMSEDYGMAVLEYPNGTSFVKTCAAEIGGFMRRQLVVSGTKGTVEIKPLEILLPGTHYTQYSEKTEYTDSNDWFTEGVSSKSELHDRYDGMLTAFASMVRGETVNPYTYDYELELYKTILKCCGC
ncbi:MAG: Gfo/Idh/MocA family oxidoreductase [Clostridia bacterium]|nr:Gfo/Idh/MocA family oxidoreductase [Clostridia bacterium]